MIAGPTASGKSALALQLAETEGGVIVNADALQVFADWEILTARPGPEDRERAPHLLYGHVPGTKAYSVGHWLRDVAPILGHERPIIVGGTGLYFTALTEGLADIPPTPDAIRDEAMSRIAAAGHAALLPELDAASHKRIDTANPMRVQRAWEVLKATGRGIAEWQDATPPPLLPLSEAAAFVLDAPKEWLDPRIDARLEAMFAAGVVNEAQRNAPDFRPDLPSAKAIGAADLVAHVRGALSDEQVRARIAALTRQYAKKQRTWFRARMQHWHQIRQ